VREGCLERLAALQRHHHQLWASRLFCYQTSLTGGSTLGASAPSWFVSLKANLLFGLNSIWRDALDGRTSCASLLSASNRSIKISASIATTFGLKRPKSDVGW
jgi:hypothetical protein